MGAQENTVKQAQDKAAFSGFSYYEYKYAVPHVYLSQVKGILDELYRDSDPFSFGIVDSIYYDTYNEDCLFQCLNGATEKMKFRIRGYGDGSFSQIQQKYKNLAGVGKLKSKISSVTNLGGSAPLWEDLQGNPTNDFSMIQVNASKVGPLIPSVRIRYQRHRYRCYDFRITLDSQIEAHSLDNGIPRLNKFVFLPEHVLEIKTVDLRPHLPFLGLIRLRQVSFSKFMLGVTMLDCR